MRTEGGVCEQTNRESLHYSMIVLYCCVMHCTNNPTGRYSTMLIVIIMNIAQCTVLYSVV